MASDTFQSITIEGFKSIRSVKVDLRPINILIGANGSGKSNFLEAFVFLGEVQAGGIDSYVEIHGGADKLFYFGSKTTKEISLVMQAANGLRLRAHYLLSGNDRLAGTGATAWWDESEPRLPSWKHYQFHDTGFHSPIKKTNQVDDNRYLRSDGSNLAAFLYLLSQRFPASYGLIRKTAQQVAPFFEDFQLEPLALNPNTIKLEWRHKRSDRYWDASEFSDGTLRFIALATLLLQPVELRPSVILIDEPELGLHPFAICLLASLIKQAAFDTQVIVATQSTLLLDYFGPEDVLVADRVDGATTIQRLNSDRLAEWLKDYSLGQLWQKGELEGTPVNE